MKTIRTLLLVLLGFLALPVVSYSQLTQQQQDKQAEQACAVCGGGMVFMLIISGILFALNIALLVWVARDAKSRGMDSSILWMFLVMFTSVIGLVIYIFARPQGELIQCANCKGKRLKVSATCPHCQHV